MNATRALLRSGERTPFDLSRRGTGAAGLRDGRRSMNEDVPRCAKRNDLRNAQAPGERPPGASWRAFDRRDLRVVVRSPAIFLEGRGAERDTGRGGGRPNPWAHPCRGGRQRVAAVRRRGGRGRSGRVRRLGGRTRWRRGRRRARWRPNRRRPGRPHRPPGHWRGGQPGAHASASTVAGTPQRTSRIEVPTPRLTQMSAAGRG